MDWQTFFTILSSIGFGSIVAAYIGKKVNDKNNYLKYITEERQKWRDKIRELTVELRKDANDEKKVARIRAEFLVRLNPGDSRDKYIIKKLSNLCREPNNENIKRDIEDSVAYLLKHDWERVKKETSGFVFNPLYMILHGGGALGAVYLLKQLIQKCSFYEPLVICSQIYISQAICTL